MSLNLQNAEYVENVRNILSFIGCYRRSTEDIQNQFPDLDVSAIMRSGIRVGWACRTQIQPDLWQANRNMLIVNLANQVVAEPVMDCVKIPPRITTLQIGSSLGPLDNQCRNFISRKCFSNV